MIIVDELTNLNKPFLNLIAHIYGPIFYLNKRDDSIKKTSKIMPINFLNNSMMTGYGDLNRGDKKLLYQFVEKFLTKKIINLTKNNFKNVEDFEKKIKISLATSFQYYNFGSANLFVSSRNDTSKIHYIHTSFWNYIYSDGGVRRATEYKHYFLPIDGIFKYFKLITDKICYYLNIKSLYNILRSIKNKKTEKINDSAFYSSCDSAIFFHKSLKYGDLYTKNQFFSKEAKHKLNKNNIACFVLEGDSQSQIVNSKSNIHLQDFVRQKKNYDLYCGTKIILFNIFKVKSVNEAIGLLFISIFFLNYKSWCNKIANYPNLRNAIIDFDLLFPKSLSIALESYSITTFAFQDRGVTSFRHCDGVIVNTYFFAGEIYKKFGLENPSIYCKNYFNFGAWRSSQLIRAICVKSENLGIEREKKIPISSFGSYICCIGWFLGEENSPILNIEAFFDFIEKIKVVAAFFKTRAFVLRFKILRSHEKSLIIESIKDFPNIYLSNDYSKDFISYSLCANAEAVISVQTSLAEECLSVGKKVVFIDSVHNLRGLCKEMYPLDFHFAVATNSNEIIRLLDKIINHDEVLINKYLDIKKKLQGEIDLSMTEVIPNFLTNYLH
ncbi:hypothetical protein MCEZE4_00446 [Burkholderiaceae bacterium]